MCHATDMGKRGPKKKEPAAAPPAPAPQGTGRKRTPTSAFDPAAGKDIYEPERIVGERLAKGVTQYHVKWAGYETFSAAGKMHGDLQKSAKDSTLEHSLFAAFNTD